jgi:IPT/TIG domain
VLGHSCGGIQEQSFATGFGLADGYPAGDVHLSTSCSGGGRGSHSTTYSAWVGVSWDFTGAVVSSALLFGPPTVDPSFSAFDANGNEVYNQTGHANLVLASGYVPRPRLTGISVSSGPTAGGTSVTIAGTGLTGATAVSFGAVGAASFTVNSDTSITAFSPASGPGRWT